MTQIPFTHSAFRPLDPALESGHVDPPARQGFFTDTSVCIGCKACEVACKEWNEVPEDGMALSGMSYDNTLALGASTWRHVAFIEQPAGAGPPPRASAVVSATSGSEEATESASGHGERPSFRWLMESDVCKHCTHAACLDVCPTGALFRTEFSTVVVQNEICNGCGYCVPACPYGVIERRTGPVGDAAVGVAQKCTLCYDRLKDGMEPACAKACPTQSIQFGDLDELRVRAGHRLELLRAAGEDDASLYGHDPDDGVGGTAAFFLLLDRPEVYGLPPDPVVTTKDLPAMWRTAGFAALTMLAGTVAAFATGRRR
jgi:formate dehydrogenase iron-sulfur subunit